MAGVKYGSRSSQQLRSVIDAECIEAPAKYNVRTLLYSPGRREATDQARTEGVKSKTKEKDHDLPCTAIFVDYTVSCNL